MMTWPGVLSFNLVDTAANAADYPVRVMRNGRIRLETLSPNARQPVSYTVAILTRSDIANTRTMTDRLGHPAIVLDLKPEGAAIFARVTTMNVGRMFAVVIDDRIISAPVVQTPIRGGSLTITGAFSGEEAEGLAVVLRTEMLPTIPRLVEIGTFGEAQ
jgi:preprotein translocase subunit SecD